MIACVSPSDREEESLAINCKVIVATRLESFFNQFSQPWCPYN